MRDEIVAEQARLDAIYARLDELKEQQATRRARLEAAEDRLCFGRAGEAGDRTAIGRVTLMRDDEPLLIDWRAPAARSFYDGTTPRVLLRTHGRRVTGIDAGPRFDADRTGRMPDIVATIQAEQDAIIRGDPSGVLVIEGGPGTGKTAVALHRAAYLLYHRPGLAAGGVLVVAPSPALLSYIDQVLPGLGETAVTLSTPTGLVPGVTPAPEDNPVKSRLVMAELLADVLRARQDAIPFPEAVARARAEGLPHNQTRPLFAEALADHFAAERRALEDTFEAEAADTFAEAGIDEAVRADLAALGLEETHDQDHDSVRATGEAWWPVLTPEQLLEALYADPHRHAAGRLTTTECDLLKRTPGTPMTTADVPLLDEAAELLGTGGLRAYGHVVVDEAQELTPMTWRMIFRRCPARSLTIAGDVAQTADPDGVTTWEDALRPHIGDRWRAARLSVNYRTPGEIMDAASELLPAAGRPRSVRFTGVHPWRSTVTEGELARLIASEAERGGMVAVIAPHDRVDALAAAVREQVPAASGPDPDLTEQVVVLGVHQIKGLEFDSVLIADPAAIMAAPRGRNALYVAMTRATKRLALLEVSRPSAPTSAGVPLRAPRSGTSPGGTGRG
ncbi:ATP-binding domain-containing protein [Actinoplanes sp. NBRC 103695]|uniref:HelD family protein n=1 Tax=Actinoplanes sp. NBRC 103695 TaxID=3032202 RepID=UPI0024A51198|nr:ATP-binding domain-containing protein [Actinoplanes sp. NBRC 103695]GLY99154.1 DNA helicase [Actinoplanes sp. NBRC 103695]